VHQRAPERAVEQIITQRLARFRSEFTDAIGQAIAAERARARKERTDALVSFAELLGGETAEMTKEERALWRKEIEDRIGRSDSAVTELLMDFERRLADLEQRVVLKPPPKPKLVDDNAA